MKPKSNVINLQELRAAFGRFATGVTVITTRQENGFPRGFTANSFTSVSLDPPLLLVCLAKSAHSLESFIQAKYFAVNVLSDKQKVVSGLFASRVPDKFDKCEWHPGPNNTPLINECIAQFSCEKENTVDAGDHIILIGRIVDFTKNDGPPLGYFNGDYFSLGLADSLAEAALNNNRVRVGAILRSGTDILLEKLESGGLRVPSVYAGIEVLHSKLMNIGFKVVIDFLYAVFEDRLSVSQGVFYHGTVSGEENENFMFYDLEKLDWLLIVDNAECQMLKRYRDEYRHGAFTLYQGNEKEGTYRLLKNLEGTA